jgi:hypothetical protein
MTYDAIGASKIYPRLCIDEEPENSLLGEIQVDIEEERMALEEQARAEDFWAGRNLAGRNSTRHAA